MMSWIFGKKYMNKILTWMLGKKIGKRYAILFKERTSYCDLKLMKKRKEGEEKLEKYS